MLVNTPNQPSKFKTKEWVEINDESLGTYDGDNQIRFKNSMVKSSVCDYRNARTFVKGTISVRNTAAQSAANNAANKKVMFKKLIHLLTA